ncbi:hypothetical protein Trydic_g19670 [Trypoxylus dichotomus]
MLGKHPLTRITTPLYHRLLKAKVELFVVLENGGHRSQYIVGDDLRSLPSFSTLVEVEWHRFPIGSFPSNPQEMKADVEKPPSLGILKGENYRDLNRVTVQAIPRLLLN